MQVREATIEQELIEKLGELKYTLRPDIRDRATLFVENRLSKYPPADVSADVRQLQEDLPQEQADNKHDTLVTQASGAKYVETVP